MPTLVDNSNTGRWRTAVSHVSLWSPSTRGFSYVDLVEGAHDGRFYALKRILCHDREGKREAQTEVEMHRLFNHPNILSLTGHTFMERGGKSEAWLLLPYVSVCICFGVILYPYWQIDK